MVVDRYLSPFLIVVVCKIRNWQIVVICSNLFYENLVVYEISNLGIPDARAGGPQEVRKTGKEGECSEVMWVTLK